MTATWYGMPNSARIASYLAGVPVLRGPYVVDYTDIPHDGDTKVLWTPQVGDVLLNFFVDWQTVIQWADPSTLYIGQNVDGPAGFNILAKATAGNIGGPVHLFSTLDMTGEAICGDATDSSSNEVMATGYVFHTTAPMQIQFSSGGPDASAGHLALYALVARAVAP